MGLFPVVATLSLASGVGCLSNAPEVVTHTLYRPLTGPCPTDASLLNRGEFANEVQGLVATVTGPGITDPQRGEGDTSVTLEGVPAGEDRVFALFGLAGGQPRWRGVSAPVLIEGGETKLDIVMAAVADVTCARSVSGPRAFHTATALPDGTILVVGGADEMADAQASCGASCLRARATATAAVYNPATGAFTTVGGLSTARMFHTASLLGDGRVVIAGGASEAEFRRVDAQQFPFPVVPRGQAITTVEVYNPDTQSFSALGADPNGARVFAAAVSLQNGDVLITGGIPALGTPHDLGNALASTTRCSAGGCSDGPPLARRRAGHMIFAINPEGVFIWGGSVDVGDGGFQFEFLGSSAAQFQLINVEGMQETRNVFFATGVQYLDFRFLGAGGLFRQANGTFLSTDSNGNNLSARAYVFDLTSGQSGGLTAPMQMRTGRIFASAAPLPDKATAIVAGGFEVPNSLDNLNWTSTADLALFNEGPPLDMLSISVGGETRTLRSPRAGLTATAIGDGTVVLVGGYVDGSERETAKTAEVFADLKTPPHAAGLQ